MVLQLFKVKLREGFAGTWFSFFPQYFTKAILLGALHWKLPFSRDCEFGFEIKSFSESIVLKFAQRYFFYKNIEGSFSIFDSH